MTRSALAVKMPSGGRAVSVAAWATQRWPTSQSTRGGPTLAMGPSIVDVHTLPGWPTRLERPDGITP
eukprot:364741-Chlamydomonas_euryale.AAC.24